MVDADDELGVGYGHGVLIAVASLRLAMRVSCWKRRSIPI